MLRILATLLTVLTLAAPSAVSLAGGVVPVAGPDTIGPGVTRTYRDGTFLVLGDIEVQPGGSLVFDNANVVFMGGAWTIHVQPGASIASVATTMSAELLEGTRELLPIDQSYDVLVEPGASVDLVSTIVQGGDGVDIYTSDATIRDVLFLDNDIGLTLHDVDVALDDLNFTRNGIGLQVLGGSALVTDSVFDQNTEGLVAQDAALEVDDSSFFAGVHGLRQEGGSNVMQRNTMKEHLEEETIGAIIHSASSALLVDNTIHNWETGLDILDTPTLMSGNDIHNDEWSQLGFVAGNGEPADHWVFDVNNNSLSGGYFRVESAWTTPSAPDIRVENNTLGNMILVTSDALVQDNTGTGSTLQAGRSTIVRNVLTSESEIAGYAGSTVADNEVSGSGSSCYYLQDSDSMRNLATDCHRGFLLDSLNGLATSTGDTATRSALTADGGRGFTLWGYDGVLTDATATANDVNVYVESDWGGWQLTRVSGTGGTTGLKTTFNTFDASVDDSDFNGNAIGVDNSGRTLFLDDTRVKDNTDRGVRVYSSTVTGQDNWIAGNGFGVFLDTNGFATLENAYWGAASGPTVSSNPGGAGDAVSLGVDYTPFRTSPPP
ncbi:MAG TPA: hypothetical protein VM370_02515 [Candidatus Thermoplasmatota archaeon]|nr:hypothetical protein [Candidatus Thermoplasmatota archaeon]